MPGLILDISTREKFAAVSNVMGQTFARTAHHAGDKNEYRGEILHHPLQIALNGCPQSGKSSLIRRAAETAFSASKDATTIIEKIPSADQKRDVTLFARWFDHRVEIRTQDLQALSALPAMYNKHRDHLGDFETPGLRFFEHAGIGGDTTAQYCKAAIKIDAKGDGSRFLHLTSEDQHILNQYIMDQSFMNEIRHLVLSAE